MEEKINLIIVLILFTSSSFAGSKLPELATKQSIDNLRFLSADGKYTYYQNREGKLLLSTNYNVKEVVSASPGTHYQVISSPVRSKLIITRQDAYHKSFVVRQLKNIYEIEFGSFQSKEIGKGIGPALHDNDNWVSFYNPILKVIEFVNLRSSALSFQVQIKNKFNPYFVPQVIMPNRNTILYTDLNNKGIPGVLYYDKITKETSVLYKANNPATKIELCLSSDVLYMGEFGLDTTYSGSSISKLNVKSIDFSKRDILYESSLNDIGNIHCRKKSLFFIQNLRKKRKKATYELVELNPLNKKINVLSDINFAAQVINMDGVLLLPHLGKYYVPRGKSDFTKTDILKNKSE